MINLSESRSVVTISPNTKRPTTLTAAVLSGIADGFRAAIPDNPTAAVLTNEQPLWCSEAFGRPVDEVFR